MTTCLHNFIIRNENNLLYFQRQYTRTGRNDIDLMGGALQEINNADRNDTHAQFVSRIRDNFASYFEHGGAVSWQ